MSECDPVNFPSLLCLRPSRYREHQTSNEVSAPHSITLSARANNASGTVTPIALAVFRLITSSNLVGCSTGMSATLVPLKSLTICWGVTLYNPLYQIEKGLFQAAVDEAQGALERAKAAKILSNVELQRKEEQS
jgi:hypothetical protein